MAQPTPQIAVPLPGPVPLAERLTAPIKRFARLEAASGILLLACAGVALAIANSPLGHAYHDILATPGTIGVGTWAITLSLEAWINDALMALFFFLVGLEIKREFVVGELSNFKKAAVPIIAAMGGMVVPGLIYAGLNWGQPTVRGWGVPTATDIAFSLGVLALLGKRVPAGLRIFLATLAIADDLGALVVIAVFYTEKLELNYLYGAGACLALMASLSIGGVRRAWPYAVVGVVLWYFVLRSGVHATIAGVLAAMVIPVRTRVDGRTFAEFVNGAVRAFEIARGSKDATLAKGRDEIVISSTQQGVVQAIEDACHKVQTPLQVMEHSLSPWIAFLVVPIFALANAGVELSGNLAHAFAQRETLGVLLGLVIGKPVGITLASFLAVRVGLGALPTGVAWRHVIGMSCLAGIGFTMSLFIAHLAFQGDGAAERLNDAKIGIIAASVVASALGAGVLLLGARGHKAR